MTRVLSGLELQGFIKERQAKQVRNLRQEHRITPTLLIVMSENAGKVIETYVNMKKRYAEDILINVKIAAIPQSQIQQTIESANRDDSIHGIIVQLPLDDASQTDQLCNMIAPEKDVDGLGVRAMFPSATAEAIDWLLAGYNVELSDKKISLLGKGKLVGGPLAKMWKERGFDVTIVTRDTKNVDDILQHSDIIVTATGVPRILTTELVPPGAVVIDAGTASEGGVVVGDVDPVVREREDITITPEKGGVGPLTYTLLFDHLIQSALRTAGKL